MKKTGRGKWVAVAIVEVVIIALVVIDAAEPNYGLVKRTTASGVSIVRGDGEESSTAEAPSRAAETTTSTTTDGVTMEDGSDLKRSEVQLGPASGGRFFTYSRETGNRVSYNGVVSNQYGTWYVKDGQVDFGYSGSYYCEKDGRTYWIVNGEVQ